jgi:epoxyqueuosine reductase
MRRVSYAQWQRNLAIALGNGPATTEALSAQQTRLGQLNDMVDEHIQWAMEKLADQIE